MSLLKKKKLGYLKINYCPLRFGQKEILKSVYYTSFLKFFK